MLDAIAFICWYYNRHCNGRLSTEKYWYRNFFGMIDRYFIGVCTLFMLNKIQSRKKGLIDEKLLYKTV